MGKKAISSMITVVILTATATILSMSVFYFVYPFSKGEIDQIENPNLITNSQLRFLYSLEDQATFYNPYTRLEVRRSLILGTECSSTPANYSRGPFEINLSSCFSQSSSNVLLETDQGFFRVKLE